jgi:O-acetyl-ADP-ribose deacetylase (regulator of RNase III)
MELLYGDITELYLDCIATGSYGFPKEAAAKISLEVVSKFLMENDFPNRVIFCCYDIDNLKHYIKLIEEKI